MNKEFLVNILFLIGVNLIIKPFYVFGIDLKVQNEVANYGLYFALLNFSYIFQMFSDLGIQQYNNRNLAQHDYLFHKYFPHLLVLKGGLALLFLVLSFTAALLVGYRGEALYLLSFLLLNQLFITFTFFFRSNLSGLQHYRLDSVLSILDKLLMIILGVPLLWWQYLGPVKIEYFVYLQSIAFGSTTLVAYLLTRRYLEGRLKFFWNQALLYGILKKSLPFSLVVLLMTLYTRVDAVMIERLLANEQTAAGASLGIVEGNIYAAAYRLLDAINMICFLFAGLLLPMFARQLRQKESIHSLLKLSLSLMLVITVSFSIAVCFNATDIMQLLYQDYTPTMSSVLVLLMMGFNAIGIIHIVGTLLTANGNLMPMNNVFVVGILLNVVANYVLIHEYQAWGAALSTIFTQSFVAVAECYLAKCYFDLRWNSTFVLQMSLFVLGTLAINIGLSTLVWLWYWKFILAGLAAVLWAVITKMIDIKSLLKQV